MSSLLSNAKVRKLRNNAGSNKFIVSSSNNIYYIQIHHFMQQTMLIENKPFSRKILIFSNFSPLVAVEYIKIFEKLFDFVKGHIKRQLYFAVKWHDSNFYFFAQAFTAPYYTCSWGKRGLTDGAKQASVFECLSVCMSFSALRFRCPCFFLFFIACLKMYVHFCEFLFFLCFGMSSVIVEVIRCSSLSGSVSVTS